MCPHIVSQCQQQRERTDARALLAEIMSRGNIVRLTRRFISPLSYIMYGYVRTYVNRMTNLTSGQRSRIYGRSCHIGGKVRDGAAQQGRRERGDGYTELPNEATAVDFVQPLCRMRQWSCNRLPINNALVSGARRKEKKKELKREVEGERQRRRRGERQRRHANVVNRATRVRTGVRAR